MPTTTQTIPARAARLALSLLTVGILAALLPSTASAATVRTASTACGAGFTEVMTQPLRTSHGLRGGGVVHLFRAKDGRTCATVERVGRALRSTGATSVSIDPARGATSAARLRTNTFAGPARAAGYHCIRLSASVTHGATKFGYSRVLWCQTSVVDKAIDVAMAQRGKPYVWGATGPTGFDCSGLTSYAFGKAGKKLPRISRDQYAALPHTDTPKRGDLVFFGTPVYHVGIYLGDGMMLHAPHTGDVVKVSPVSWMGTPAKYGSMS